MDLSPFVGPLLGQILTWPVFIFALVVALICETVKRVVRLSWAGAKDSDAFNEGVLYLLPLVVGAILGAVIQGRYQFPDFITNRVAAAMGGMVLGGGSGFLFNRVKKIARLRAEALEKDLKSAKSEPPANDTTPRA